MVCVQAQCTTPFFYEQSIFDPHPENCFRFSKKSPQKIVSGFLKNRPKKLFSNCLVEGQLTSIV